MLKKDTQIRNRDIALMLGRKEDAFLLQKNIEGNTDLCHLHYHCDWNWLMSVVRFIYSIEKSSEVKFDISVKVGSANIEDAFTEVSDYAKRYNASTKTSDN